MTITTHTAPLINRLSACLAILILTVFSASVHAQGQVPPGTSRVLLPLNVDVVLGIGGSIWRTDFQIANSGDQGVEVIGAGSGSDGTCPSSPVEVRFP